MQDVAELAALLAPFGPVWARDRAERVRRTLAKARGSSSPGDPTETFAAPVESRAAAGGGTATAWRQEGNLSDAHLGGRKNKHWLALGAGVLIVGLLGGVWRLATRPSAKPSAAPTTSEIATANQVSTRVESTAPAATLPAATALVDATGNPREVAAPTPPTASVAAPPSRAFPPQEAGARARDRRREGPYPASTLVAPAPSVEYSPVRDSRL